MTGRWNLSRSDWLFLTRHYHIVHEQKKAVDNVHIADSAVEIYRKQVDTRISLLYPVFYPPLHYMIRYTAERLQGYHVADPMPAVGCDLRRKEPALPEDCIEGNQLPAVPGLLEYVTERPVISESGCLAVHLAYFLHKEAAPLLVYYFS